MQCRHNLRITFTKDQADKLRILKIKISRLIILRLFERQNLSEIDTLRHQGKTDLGWLFRKQKNYACSVPYNKFVRV